MEQIASRFVLLAALAAGVLVVPTAGEAQLIAGPGLGSKAKNAGPPPAPPPPALPGARVSKEMVAPPDRPPSDLQPNDALFDAINRGDIATARDAISRGADLNARNVLGMTPMELSVDLGRNDISFAAVPCEAAVPATDHRLPRRKRRKRRRPRPRRIRKRSAGRRPARCAKPPRPPRRPPGCSPETAEPRPPLPASLGSTPPVAPRAEQPCLNPASSLA